MKTQVKVTGLFLLLTPLLMAQKHQELKGIDLVSQNETSIDPTANKATAVIFLSARCSCSKSHEYLVKEAAEKYKEFSFVVVHSNANETDRASREHFDNSKFPFPVLRDASARIADQLGAQKSPHAIILDSRGEIVLSGGLTDTPIGTAYKRNYLDESLASLRAGKKIPQKEVASLSCIIQRPSKAKLATVAP